MLWSRASGVIRICKTDEHFEKEEKGFLEYDLVV